MARVDHGQLVDSGPHRNGQATLIFLVEIDQITPTQRTDPYYISPGTSIPSPASSDGADHTLNPAQCGWDYRAEACN
jgi:hypothetical protein